MSVPVKSYIRKDEGGKDLSRKEEHMGLFKDRRDAGRKLAQELSAYAGHSDVIVLALPRGGVPVAYEVARALNTPLDIFIVRKLGFPGHEELAIGAIASGGVRVLNEDIVQGLKVSQNIIDLVTRQELQELERRERAYRGDRPGPDVRGHTVILIDDGLATGASMRAAVAALRLQNPARIVIAVPTAARETCEALRPEVDEIICAMTPEPFYGVGRWYENFSQTTDEEVRLLLEQATQQVQHG
jgi:putative phosphoribosyl transferase